MDIKTNRHWRNFTQGCDLPEKAKSEFDYLENIDNEQFIHYKGKYYSLSSEILSATGIDLWPEWHGYAADSHSSGILIRLTSDGEMYQVATYIN